MKVYPPLGWTLHKDRAYILFVAIWAVPSLVPGKWCSGNVCALKRDNFPKTGSLSKAQWSLGAPLPWPLTWHQVSSKSLHFRGQRLLPPHERWSSWSLQESFQKLPCQSLQQEIWSQALRLNGSDGWSRSSLPRELSSRLLLWDCVYFLFGFTFLLWQPVNPEQGLLVSFPPTLVQG